MSESVFRIREQMKERQINNIMALPTGRWLDALVAEYVMGYSVEEWRIAEDDPVDYGYRSNSAIRKLGEQEAEAQRVPNYSTVLYSAMQIVSQFQFWAIEGNADDNEYHARFSNDRSAPGSWVTCSTIPETICKAALVGLVNENKLLDKLLND